MASNISCRMITSSDLEGLIDLVRLGFPRRSRDYWKNGFRKLSRHVPPAGFPQFGHLLTSAGRPVGLHMLISSRYDGNNTSNVRCNVSTWYVREEFRLFAPLLITRATREPAATYTSLQPRAETVRVIEAQGFRKHSQGVFATTPSFRPKDGRSIRFLTRAADWTTADVSLSDLALLHDHRTFGCICLWAVSPHGSQPLILRRRLTSGGLPCAQLLYYRTFAFLEQVIGPLSRYLAVRGMPVILAPATHRPEKAAGRYYPGKFAVYCKGTPSSAACDLSYTEAAIFGM